LEDLAGVPGHSTPELFAAGTTYESRRPEPNFTELRAALLEIDSSGEWGGLRERELPENRGIVYLCHEHRQALRYPAQS
jgi:internalin A